CRFPGAEGPEQFWQLLTEARTAITPIPADRWNNDRYYHPDPDTPGHTYARHGGFLHDVRGFDPTVFGITPREAAAIDPQHRIILETAWHALEHAHIPPDSLHGTNTAVYIGMRAGEYERLATPDPDSIDEYTAIGASANFAANRLSYALGLQGPSLVVDTACSASLVAVHLACQALRTGETDTALAGGVNLILSPDAMIALSKGRMLSPTGQCHTFDHNADGYVRGEGCGIVVLKRLSDAQEAGDHIWAVIRGSAVNQDGASAGITVPRGPAQEEVIHKALADAGVEPQHIDYVETHGTGTALGDPIEIRALTHTLTPNRPHHHPLHLGSVKTNIGHLEAAAGIAGLIKTILTLHHRTIPPHPTTITPNPHIPWNPHLHIPTTPTPLTTPTPTAATSSFGFGGTNAHLILQHHPTPTTTTDTHQNQDQDQPHTITLSATTPTTLHNTATQLLHHLHHHPTPLPHLAYTTTHTRTHHPHRATITTTNHTHLTQALTALTTNTPHPHLTQHHTPPTTTPHTTFLVPAATQDPDSLVAWWGERGVVADTVLTEHDPEEFRTAVKAAAAAGAEIFIELGPRGLEHLVRQCPGGETALYLPTYAPDDPDPDHRHLMQQSLGVLWTRGVAIDWSAICQRPEKIPNLPRYPFEHRDYWVPSLRHEMALVPADEGVALRPRFTETAAGQLIAETELSLAALPLLDEHRVHGRIVVPAIAFLELMHRCAHRALDGPFALRNLALTRPLILADDAARTVQAILDPDSDGQARIRVFARDPHSGWQQLLQADVVTADSGNADELEPEEFERARGRCLDELDHEEFYRRAWHPSFALGASFRLVQSALRGRAAAVGFVATPDPECAALTAGVRSDLLLMDICAQLVAVAASTSAVPERPVYVGTGFASMTVRRSFTDGEIRCTAVLRDDPARGRDDGVLGDVSMTDEDGVLFALISGVSFRPLTAETVERLTAAPAPAGSPAQAPKRSKVARPDPSRLRQASPQQARQRLEQYLAALLGSIEGCEAEEIDPAEPVITRADSLMLAEFVTAVDHDLNVRLPMHVLFDSASPASLATTIADEIRAAAPDTAAPASVPDPSAPTLDPVVARQPRPLSILKTGKLTRMSVAEMAERAALPPSIAAAEPASHPDSAPGGTLLTGATGFVGAFLLAELLERRAGDVYCLARASSPQRALERILTNLDTYGIDVARHRSRIVALPGDLTEPGFGLDDEALADLHMRCGDIVHCGAQVKWTYPYQALERANVYGTREVLRLATMGGPVRPVHFISTVGVFSSVEYEPDAVYESQPPIESGPLAVGYAQSKWVAEQMIRTAHQRGVPTTIHRINTGGDSRTGAFNRVDHLSMMLKGCIEAGVGPQEVNIHLQPAPIDYVAAAVVEIARRPELSGGTFHLVNDTELTWPQLFAMVREFGYPVDLTTFDDWRDRITGSRSGTMALLGLVPFLVDTIDDARVPRFDSAWTRHALTGTGLACPPLTTGLVHTYLRRFISARFVAPPKGAVRAVRSE
ncbi:thioester reductase domain-containing protein, partial [Plantactinospora sp. ZYX-F-223]|uniref:thioester reductase domain-containing protein n=1 Tax=Plantactinospora sp. ZYX-F-223 TaxID=3144103 RepID=UPI0031FCE72B